LTRLGGEKERLRLPINPANVRLVGEFMKRTVISIVCVLPVLLAAEHAVAQTSASPRNSATAAASTAAPDNTRSNKEDSSNRATTADMQKNNAGDLDLAKRIRSSVMADKDLSTYGHNVKIVAVNGTVTLNGVVRSAEEKAQIGAKAVAVAGKEHVVNYLKVEPQN
jgi:hyperosmotically inducible protein